MPAASDDSAGMSAEDLKARLRDVLKQRGVLDEIKAKIRAQFIASMSSGAAAEELQLQSKTTAAAQAQLSFNDRLCCSIVFDFLQSKQLLNTVSVFVPESSIGNTVLPQPDLLQALHLPATTPSSGPATVLDVCVAKLSKQVLPAFVEVSSQTESGAGSVREHLDLELLSLKQKYAALHELHSSQLMQQQMAQASEEEMEARIRAETTARFELQLQRDLALVRSEEAVKRQKEVEQIRADLDAHYKFKLERLEEREKQVQQQQRAHVLEAERREHELRQKWQREFEDIRAREFEVKRNQFVDHFQHKANWAEDREQYLRQQFQAQLAEQETHELERRRKLQNELSELQARESETRLQMVDATLKLQQRQHELQAAQARIDELESRVREFEAKLRAAPPSQAPPAANGDNSTIKQLRAQLEAKCVQLDKTAKSLREERLARIALQQEADELNKILDDYRKSLSHVQQFIRSAGPKAQPSSAVQRTTTSTRSAAGVAKSSAGEQPPRSQAPIQHATSIDVSTAVIEVLKQLKELREPMPTTAPPAPPAPIQAPAPAPAAAPVQVIYALPPESVSLMHSANHVGSRYSLGGSCEFAAQQPEMNSEVKPDVTQQRWWRAPSMELHRQQRLQHFRPTTAEQEDEVMFDPTAAGPAGAASTDRTLELERLISMQHPTKEAECPSTRQAVAASEAVPYVALEPPVQPRTLSPNPGSSNPTSTTSDATQHVAEQPHDDEAAEVVSSTQQAQEEASQANGTVSTEVSVAETEERNERTADRSTGSSTPAAASDIVAATGVQESLLESKVAASVERAEQLPQPQQQKEEQEHEEDDGSREDAEQQQQMMIDALQAAKMRVLERRKKQRQAMEPQTKKQQPEPQTSDAVEIIEGIETVSHGSDEWI